MLSNSPITPSPTAKTNLIAFSAYWAQYLSFIMAHHATPPAVTGPRHVRQVGLQPTRQRHVASLIAIHLLGSVHPSTSRV